MTKSKIFLLILLVLFLVGCNRDNAGGIKIEHTLYSSMDYFENKKLCNLIESTLNKDKESLTRLVNFDCEGGTESYELGFIIVQIISKLGEDEFMKMSQNLTSLDKHRLVESINVGLMYGHPEDLNFEDEFPLLYEQLKEFH